MVAIIGKYRTRMKETGLIITHPTGLSFDLTVDEALELMKFIEVYQASIEAAQRDTEPSIERVVVDEQCNSDTDGDDD
ncbi:MAG TPA: hypothetical protein VF043_05295 [Ktedonobacteraceae bacterium]